MQPYLLSDFKNQLNLVHASAPRHSIFENIPRSWQDPHCPDQRMRIAGDIRKSL